MIFILLIQKLKNREESAFKELVFSFSKRLMTVAVLYSKDREEAKDILQDTFIKIFENIDKFKGEEEYMFVGWCKRILINLALTRNSKFYRSLEQSISDEHSEVSFDSGILSDLFKEEIIQVVNELPEGYRQVFALFVIEGYTHKDIALQMGIKESSSRSKFVRAKRMLQNKIHTFSKV